MKYTNNNNFDILAAYPQLVENVLHSVHRQMELGAS